MHARKLWISGVALIIASGTLLAATSPTAIPPVSTTRPALTATPGEPWHPTPDLDALLADVERASTQDAGGMEQKRQPVPRSPHPTTAVSPRPEIVPLTNAPTQSDRHDGVQSMRNPAAVYCAGLGYEYKIVSLPDGNQQGVCVLPDGKVCDAWDFLAGRCGQSFNICARRGLDTVTRPDRTNPFDRQTAFCTDAAGQTMISAIDAASLVEKSSGVTLLNHPNPPADSEVSSSLRLQSIPPSFDWRTYNGANWMTPVRNQGMCGSCWAFAAVGVAEAVTNIGNRDPSLDPDMSEQYLVTDCAADVGNCAGGWGTSALKYIRDYGIPDEDCLPYRDGDYSTGCSYISSGNCNCSTCNYCSSSECSDYRCADRCNDWNTRLYSLERVSTVWNPARDEIKTALLSHGPLAVSLYMGGSFDANGVYHCTNPPYTNHGVVIVGYNDSGGYWIVRNSWGSTWNGDGYFKVAYGNCLIENYFTYADLVVCNDGNEINDSPGFATALAYGQTVQADICSTGDEDWYKFTGNAGDKVVVDIDAEAAGSSLDSYIYLVDADGSTVLTKNNDEGSGSLDSRLGHELGSDGTYYVRVLDYNSRGGTDYTYSLHLFTDFVTPTARIVSPTSDSWLNPITQTIIVTASDDESGIRDVTFFWHSGDWGTDWVVLGTDRDPADGWSYDFDTSVITEQTGAAFFVYVADWAGNLVGAASWNLGLDRTPPTVTVNIQPVYGDAPFRDFWVNWSGEDNLSGVAAYDVQYRDGTGGTWTDLAIGTTNISTHFVGVDGHTYYFRVRARDLAGNQGTYADDGDAHHTVQVCPIPADLYEPDDTPSSASSVIADGRIRTHNFHVEQDEDWVRFYAMEGITYTLSTTGTSRHSDTVLSLYDRDGAALIATNDDYPGMGYWSRLDWQPSVSGFYYVRIRHWDPWACGCTTEYGFSIAGSEPTVFRIYLPLALRNR